MKDLGTEFEDIFTQRRSYLGSLGSSPAFGCQACCQSFSRWTVVTSSNAFENQTPNFYLKLLAIPPKHHHTPRLMVASTLRNEYKLITFTVAHSGLVGMSVRRMRL